MTLRLLRINKSCVIKWFFDLSFFNSSFGKGQLNFLKMSAETKSNTSYKPSTNEKGEFVRKNSNFRERVTADGSSEFKAERNRYHLYVSLACPWAHRTLIVRKLKGLEKVISVDVVDWLMEDKGWKFDTEGRYNLSLFT